MQAVAYFHAKDPKDVLLEQFEGFKWEEIEVAQDNAIIVAQYLAPEKTAGGIYRTDTNRDEDKHQGKVGLVMKIGPKAFIDGGEWTFSIKPEVGDWVYYRPGDTWALTINGVLCRTVEDIHVRGRIQHPDQVY